MIVIVYDCMISKIFLKHDAIYESHTFISGHSHRSGSTNSPDRRIHAAASHDGNLRHPDTDAARSRARSDSVIYPTGESLRKIRRKQKT